MNYDSAALRQLKENATWYFILGIGLIILGTLALFYSFYATLVSVVYLGVLLTIFGVIEAVKSFQINKWGMFLLHLLLGVLYFATGIFMILNPAFNAVTLTLLLALLFIASGIARIVFSFIRKFPQHGWILMSGVLNTVLGSLIFLQWPYSGFWVIGMFMGIDMIFTGWAWIQLSMLAKNINGENRF